MNGFSFRRRHVCSSVQCYVARGTPPSDSRSLCTDPRSVGHPACAHCSVFGEAAALNDLLVREHRLQVWMRSVSKQRQLAEGFLANLVVRKRGVQQQFDTELNAIVGDIKARIAQGREHGDAFVGSWGQGEAPARRHAPQHQLEQCSSACM